MGEPGDNVEVTRCKFCFSEIDSKATICPVCHGNLASPTLWQRIISYRDSIALITSAIALVATLREPVLNLILPPLKLDGAELSFELLNPEYFNIEVDDRIFREQKASVSKVIPVIRIVVTNSGRTVAAMKSFNLCYLKQDAKNIDVYMNTVDLAKQMKTFSSIEPQQTKIIELAVDSSQESDKPVDGFRAGECDLGYTDKYGTRVFRQKLNSDSMMVLQQGL